MLAGITLVVRARGCSIAHACNSGWMLHICGWLDMYLSSSVLYQRQRETETESVKGVTSMYKRQQFTKSDSKYLHTRNR
eukprot:1148810-Pelagomonas_calceolata.AAC.2